MNQPQYQSPEQSRPPSVWELFSRTRKDEISLLVGAVDRVNALDAEQTPIAPEESKEVLTAPIQAPTGAQVVQITDAPSLRQAPVVLPGDKNPDYAAEARRKLAAIPERETRFGEAA